MFMDTAGESVSWVKVGRDHHGKEIITGERNKQDNLPSRLL